VDPITSGLSMQEFIPAGYWNRTGAHILCLGAGGSAVAISVYLARTLPQGDRPARVIFVNRTPSRLNDLRRRIDENMPGSGITFEFVENSDPTVNDRLMSSLPPGSMVINATGMGKDTPGSPITDAGLFPQDGIAWELNYRGELDFLHQAERQIVPRHLTVVDGWTYFLAGWAMIVGQIFDVNITPVRFSELRRVAEHGR
jgi:shikimate dehydrogenase